MVAIAHDRLLLFWLTIAALHSAGVSAKPAEVAGGAGDGGYSPLQQAILEQNYPLATEIAKSDSLEASRDWNDKRAILETLLEVRPSLIDDKNFSEEFVRLASVDCQILRPAVRSCKGEGSIEFILTDKGSTEQLSLVVLNRELTRYEARIRLPFSGNRTQFGQKIHIIKDRRNSTTFYFIVREIESGRVAEAKGEFVYQTLNFFKVSKTGGCKIGEALVDRHDKYYELMAAAIKIFGKDLTCKEEIIRL